MLSDLDIARNASLKPISEIAAELGLSPDESSPYGHYIAKVDSNAVAARLADRPNGKLVLVTAINPTPAGEGKTTTTVGLGQALHAQGISSMICLREPSLGPVFGMKGGAAGGGYAQVLPMDEINLHFTGDIHAITSANNLISALIDNHIQQGNELGIDPRQINWKRSLDMNDRALRNVVIGLGGRSNGTPREDHFQITVASEIMAVLCLSKDLEDLKGRVDRIVLASTYDGHAVTAADLGITGSVAALLRDAMQPNLVQTLNHSPALVHGGPFANIAHGCNSLIATKLALKLADVVVTEAGFGADLGAEKFFDIKCRQGDLSPSAAVIVCTVRALRYNGGVKKAEVGSPNLAAMQRGLVNLAKHLENIKKFGVPAIVAVNHFASDSKEELNALKLFCEEHETPMALSRVFEQGAAGGQELADTLMKVLEDDNGSFCPLYELEQPIKKKIGIVAKEIYGASDVSYSADASRTLRRLEKQGYGDLPVCMAKTQYSLSDNPRKLGRPENFTVTIRDVSLSAGAGFIVCITGDMMTMPGLPITPAALNMDVDKEGFISGLY